MNRQKNKSKVYKDSALQLQQVVGRYLTNDNDESNNDKNNDDDGDNNPYK